MAVDYWALGILIYEMVVGESPFVAVGYDGHMEVLRNILKGKIRYPPNCDLEWKDIVSKLLQKDVKQRLGTHETSCIRDHPWFATMDWVKLFDKQLPAPWIPELKESTDSHYFAEISPEELTAMESPASHDAMKTAKNEQLWKGF